MGVVVGGMVGVADGASVGRKKIIETQILKIMIHFKYCDFNLPVGAMVGSTVGVADGGTEERTKNLKIDYLSNFIHSYMHIPYIKYK